MSYRCSVQNLGAPNVPAANPLKKGAFAVLARPGAGGLAPPVAFNPYQSSYSAAHARHAAPGAQPRSPIGTRLQPILGSDPAGPPLRQSASEPALRQPPMSPLLAPPGGTLFIGQGGFGSGSGRDPNASWSLRSDSGAGGAERIQKRRSVMELLSNPDLQRVTKTIFDLHDADSNGLLSFDDLRTTLSELHLDLGLSNPDMDKAEQLFKKFDVDNSRALDFSEFFELFKAELRMSAFEPSALLGRECFVTKHAGSVWDRYERLKEIGAGSFGTAWLVKQRFSKEERVVKGVKKSRVQIPVEDVEREIMVMRQVDHPHIIRLRRWYEDKKSIYLVMDALKGGTLREVVLDFGSKKQRGVKEDWIRAIMKQCIQAMSYCHSLRLIHKDLKDENVMLLQKDPTYQKPFAVIIDLGLAEMFSAEDPTGQQVGGTPTTMAPEVWAGTFGPKCDVWSLGCVLFELLTGQMPFMATTINPQAWIRLHKRGADYTKIRTSAQGKALCKELLTFSEGRRPTMNDALQHEWFLMDRHVMRSVEPANFAQLQSFCNESALKRGLLLQIASKLPMESAEGIIQFFQDFDTDGDGRVSLSELKEGFKRMGLDDPTLADRTFKIMDLDEDGNLAFTEFSSLVLVLFKDLMEDRLSKMIAEYDDDHNMALDPEEMQHFIADITQLINKKGGVLGGGGRSAEIVEELQEASRKSISYDQVCGRLLNSRGADQAPSGSAGGVAAVGTPLRRSGDVTPLGAVPLQQASPGKRRSPKGTARFA